MAATVGWRPRCCLSHGELRPCRRVHCSRDPACLLLGCKLLWLCNSEDSRTFSMKTKIVIFFLWWNLLSLKFHQVFSSKFPLYGMLILFHKKVHLVRKKKRPSTFSLLSATNLEPVLGCVKGVCVPFGVPRFFGGTNFSGKPRKTCWLGRSQTQTVAVLCLWSEITSFFLFKWIRKHREVIFRVKNKTFELHNCLWSNHRKVSTGTPLAF